MSGASSRRKGAAGEREFIRMVNEALGLRCRRELKQYQQAQNGDIDQLVGPYLVEIKNHAKPNIPAFWKQAVTQADRVGAVPALAYKLFRKGWRVLVPIPQAWASEQQWRRDLQYTMDLAPDGFFLIVREHLQ